jgi:hypothetical protein
VTATISRTGDPFGQPAQPTRLRGDELVRGGRYWLPDPETLKVRGYTRVTTLVKGISDQYLIGERAKRMVVAGLGAREDLYWRAAAVDPDDRKGLGKLADEAMEAAKASSGANFGTALHDFKQAVDYGRSVALPEKVRPKIENYKALMAAHGVSVVPGLTERVVRIDKYGAAGKFDDVVRDPSGPGGPDKISDLKSQRQFWTWLEIAAQLSCYADADAMWDVDRAIYVDMPPVCKDWAVVTWMPVERADEGDQDGVHLFDVPLAPGREVAEMCLRIRELRTAAKSWGTLRAVPAVSVVEAYAARLRDAGSREELSAIWREATERGAWCDELEAVGLARFRELTP